MPSITRLASRATVLATAFGAAVALASGPASASTSMKGWSPQCDWGKACIRLASDAGRWWNLNSCGYNPINDRYSWAKAHGNAFTVTYVNARGTGSRRGPNGHWTATTRSSRWTCTAEDESGPNSGRAQVTDS